VRDDEAALDIVQDSMIKLSEKYGDKPVAELPMLFQRILQNTVRDHFRRTKVRSFWTINFSAMLPKGEAGEDTSDVDILETLEAQDGSKSAESASDEVDRAQTLKIIESEIEKLPARQREAFVLRYWEEMDVAETAKVMGCSEGSVKTHCSRATHTLAEALKNQGLTLEALAAH
jgi:RNA polymerase sigma-70 factor, ECF subfamily